SDTERTLFTSTTDQAPIPVEGTVTFAVVIVIAETFVPELQNRGSQAFRILRSRFLEFLIRIYQNRRGFIGIIFNSFSQGSVVADIEILFNSTQPIPTVEEVQSPIAEARDNGSAPFNISSLQVTKKGESQDGFETWKIGVTVCLAFVLLLLIFISAVVIVNGSKGKQARSNLKNRRNSFDLDFDLFSSDGGKFNAIP
ncbi:Hypothetical predicted protein, partial [Paramuricea clavata]